MAARSLWRSESALGAYCRRLSVRMDKPEANPAAAHKLARMVSFCLLAARPSPIGASSGAKNGNACAASSPSSAAPGLRIKPALQPAFEA